MNTREALTLIEHQVQDSAAVIPELYDAIATLSACVERERELKFHLQTVYGYLTIGPPVPLTWIEDCGQFLKKKGE